MFIKDKNINFIKLKTYLTGVSLFFKDFFYKSAKHFAKNTQSFLILVIVLIKF